MPRRDRRHSRRRTPLLSIGLVLALVAGGAVVWSTGLAAPLTDPVEDRVATWWQDWRADEPTDPGDPADVAPPEQLDLPEVELPAPVALVSGPAALSPTAVRRALDRPLRDRLLGPRSAVAVAGLTGPVVHARGSASVPASATKLLTSVAALHTIDPATRFRTRAVLEGRRVVLVGGGDPFLEREPAPAGTEVEPERADLATLARRTARALRADGVRRVRLGYDDSLFSGPGWNPTWPDTYRADVIAPISALLVSDGIPAAGFGRVADPSYAAAEAFAGSLRAAGIAVEGAPTRARAAAEAEALAEVESATLAQVVDRVLQVSDNEAAEILLRHIGLATGGRGSTVDGVAGVEEALADLGVPAPRELHDGSGLSRDNLVTPTLLVRLLQAVASSDDDDPLRVVWPGLPVAGFSGSLAYRFDDAPAAAVGHVRAKTGTLRGIRALAGVVLDRDGAPMVFALMADRIAEDDDESAEAVLDRAAAALGACRCARP